MIEVKKGNYWVCIIGPTEHDKLPDGADFPLRQSVMEAFQKVTGHEDLHCWSGWGNDEKQVKRMLKVKFSDK